MHTHFAYPMPPNFVLPAAQDTQIPFTVMPHAVDIFLKLNAERNNIIQVSQSPLCRRIFAEGYYHQDFFVRLGIPQQKIRILRNYCDEEEFWSKELRPIHNLKSLVSISRFQEKKGLPYLVRAFKRVKSDNLTLRLYGYGPQEDELKSLASDDPRIQVCPGPTSAAEVKDILNSADLFILPCIETTDGDKDGLPTVLREAMAAGVPVLTTRISSIPDLVEHQMTGFLADSANENSLVCQIEEIMRLSPDRLLMVRRMAQDKILKEFSKDTTINGLLEIWKKG